MKALNELEYPNFGINPEIHGDDNRIKMDWKYFANEVVLSSNRPLVRNVIMNKIKQNYDNKLSEKQKQPQLQMQIRLKDSRNRKDKPK